MRKTKTQVISDLTAELLSEREFRFGMEEKIKKLQTKTQKLKISLQKYKLLHKDKQEALNRAYQADLKSAKTIADLKQKVLPTTGLAIWLYGITFKMDGFINKIWVDSKK